MQHAILVQDLSVSYRQRLRTPVAAVRGLTFQVNPGEVVGFIGPNGAGKSSTIKALMGFTSPDSGECKVADLPAGSVEAKRFIGYLPEVALYYPYLTPVETLELYGELQGLTQPGLRKHALDLLEIVGLGSATNKLNRQLSKGMLQRVGIAQSLLGDPKVLILDEVTSGLDPVGRNELRDLLRQRRDAGATIFFSSHELPEVEALCDRLLFIHQGQIVEERVVDELREELRLHEVVYRGTVDLGSLCLDSAALASDTVRARFASKEALLGALAKVHAEGGEVLDITVQQGSLEDYFVEAIRTAA